MKPKSKTAAPPSPQNVMEVYETLLSQYPEPKTELIFENPFQLLIAVILSAQCTDERVNQTTPHLFKAYPTAKKLGEAPQKNVEKIIHSCGFFRAKAKAIISAAKDLHEVYRDEMPRTLEELMKLRGVGRKTASVVLNQAFNLPAIAVDTHVARVSERLGWANGTDPLKIEMQLRELLDEKYWSTINTLLILHGRRVCKARKPVCGECVVSQHCRYFKILEKQER